MIGTSLKFCIMDICKGDIHIDDVSQIFTRTKCKDKKQFRKIVKEYRKIYWNQYPEKATKIARELWNSGRIAQPRFANLRFPKLKPGKYWF